MRRAAIERLLPAAYQRAGVPGSVLFALLEVMEALHAPDEAVLADVDALFAPYRAPDGFVGYLTRWVAMDHVLASPRPDAPPALPMGRLRDLVAHGAHLARWRGTPYGMRSALELATGVTGFVLDEPVDRPFHLVVRVPPAAAGSLALIGRIVAAEKPAAVTAEVVLLGDADPADPPADPPTDQPATGWSGPAADPAPGAAIGRHPVDPEPGHPGDPEPPVDPPPLPTGPAVGRAAVPPPRTLPPPGPSAEEPS
ncbi:phage tail protein domain-containing protein [Micromonospora purpureochromogenes]|uniref:Phage tail protein domain-containing protein n=1 Tax=Micromonospora purpureochromogenes TaxID=47872 RepID=A0A1C4XYE4_9ACTN|nr:phage tail protein [Micromonospora purpureochromogenes]SCF13478.1 phage tail protein domain-containing protein [Micromonospora purpureochromogenes]